MLKKVISGGQCGADRLGLEIAKELGIETGGIGIHHKNTDDTIKQLKSLNI